MYTQRLKRPKHVTKRRAIHFEEKSAATQHALNFNKRLSTIYAYIYTQNKLKCLLGRLSSVYVGLSKQIFT